MFQTKVEQKIKKYFTFNNPPPHPKIVLFMRYKYAEKYCKTGQTTDDNMTDAHCLLDT